ncbi:hypothetical protein [uncultured Piscinibacter sp.]|uniref:hypothetical protein n=1 Tax=uncultured Piscinibacter sp. TaxID=1131835 RepID=UPI002610903E|nr:hypothetical protein [uncultured Piscinibacter sp.]
MNESTRARPPRLRALVATCAVALGLGQSPAMARHPDLEMDNLSQAQVSALLQNELDDDDLIECGLADLNGAVSSEDLVEILMCALGDDNDGDDEDDLDIDDLEAECEEAGTHVEDVVRAAVASVQRRADASGVRLAFAESPSGQPDPASSWDALELLIAQGAARLFVRPPKSAVLATQKSLIKVVFSAK